MSKTTQRIKVNLYSGKRFLTFTTLPAIRQIKNRPWNRRIYVIKHWLCKKSFFRSLNRNASEEVILELIRSKCIPILIYGLECLAFTKSDLRSLDFAVNRFLMKIFRSNNSEIIAGCDECRRYFQFNQPSELIEKKKIKFERNYGTLQSICLSHVIDIAYVI